MFFNFFQDFRVLSRVAASNSYVSLFKSLCLRDILKKLLRVNRLDFYFFFYWLQQALMILSCWKNGNLRVFWRVMTIKVTTLQMMKHHLVHHQVRVNCQVKTSVIVQNVSMDFYLPINDVMISMAQTVLFH